MWLRWCWADVYDLAREPAGSCTKTDKCDGALDAVIIGPRANAITVDGINSETHFSINEKI